jgi:hypothetical protein
MEQQRAWSLPQIESRWQRWFVVVIYAAAMAWVEAAVVFYIRSHIHRLVPYQPEPLPLAGGFGFAEVVRELATMVMLATVGWLAGNTRRTRIAFSFLAFGVWDIAYYIWLVPLTGWPRSIDDWDVLFLIPLPWWGPVWAPVSIALLMIAFGTVVAVFDSADRPLIAGRKSWAMAAFGSFLAIYVFTADSLRAIIAEPSISSLRTLLPQSYNWPVFAMALLFLAAPLASVGRQLRTDRLDGRS